MYMKIMELMWNWAERWWDGGYLGRLREQPNRKMFSHREHRFPTGQADAKIRIGLKTDQDTSEQHYFC